MLVFCPYKTILIHIFIYFYFIAWTVNDFVPSIRPHVLRTCVQWTWTARLVLSYNTSSGVTKIFGGGCKKFHGVPIHGRTYDLFTKNQQSPLDLGEETTKGPHNSLRPSRIAVSCGSYLSHWLQVNILCMNKLGNFYLLSFKVQKQQMKTDTIVYLSILFKKMFFAEK